MNNQLSPSDHQEIAQLVRENKPIEAIKIYREKTGAGLKEAKEAIDRLQAGLNPAPAAPARPVEQAEVLHLFQTKGKIAAIKLYRDRTPGCGLKEAKEAVEELARQHGMREPRGGCFSMLAVLVLLGFAAGAGGWWLVR